MQIAPTAELVQRRIGGTQTSEQLLTLHAPASAGAEAIRTMRTHIIARHLEDGRRGVAVCGQTDDVGCTFTAANLAVALSQIGVSTLLIDGNMLRPGLGRYFIGPEAEGPGLIQCLSDDGPAWQQLVHPEVLPQLSLLYSGGTSALAHELLGSDRFSTLVNECMRDYEFTIIDTPPAMDSTDAERISSIVGYALLVAHRHTSFMAGLKRFAAELRDDGVTIIGAVMSETAKA